MQEITFRPAFSIKHYNYKIGQLSNIEIGLIIYIEYFGIICQLSRRLNYQANHVLLADPNIIGISFSFLTITKYRNVG